MKRLLLAILLMTLIPASASATRVCGALDNVSFGYTPIGPYQSSSAHYAVVAVNPTQASYAQSLGTNIEPVSQGSDNFLRISWYPVPNAKNYLVYREYSLTNPTHLGKIATVHAPGTSFDDTNPLAHGVLQEVCGPKIGS